MSISGTDDTQNSFNPTDQLPYETLVQIFMRCLPRENLNICQPHPSWAPMLLCHVCARWRAVALNEPALWRRVYFSCRYDYKMKKRLRRFDVTFSDMFSSAITQRDVDSICWWIENAKALSLTIRFELLFHLNFAQSCQRYTFPHQSVPPNVNQVDNIKQAFFSARHLEINWICAAAFRSRSAADDHLPLEGPHLETLLIHDKRDASQESSSPTPHEVDASLERIFPFQQKLPHLRRLVLHNNNISLGRYGNGQSVPWDQLTYICLSKITMSLATWFKLLHKFVRLEIGRFHLLLQESDAGSPQFFPLTIKNLRKFHLKWPTSRERSRLLQDVLLPSLTHLHIDAYFTLQGLLDILKSTPCVQTLHLGCYVPCFAAQGSRFCHLTHPKLISHFVPRLRHLVLTLSKRDIIDCESRYFLESVLTCPWLGLQSLDDLRHLELDFVLGARSAVFPTQIVKKTTINHFADDLKISVRDPSARSLWDVPLSADDLLWSGFTDSDDLRHDFQRVYI